MAQQAPWSHSCQAHQACQLFPSLLPGPSVLKVLDHPLDQGVHRVPVFQGVPLCQLHHLPQVHPGGQGVQGGQAGLEALEGPFLQWLPDLLLGPLQRSRQDLAGLEALEAQCGLGGRVFPEVPWHQAHPLLRADHCCLGDPVSHSHPLVLGGQGVLFFP